MFSMFSCGLIGEGEPRGMALMSREISSRRMRIFAKSLTKFNQVPN